MWALARDPNFFVYLLKLIFLPAKDSGVVEPEIEDMAHAQKLASQAYDVLHGSPLRVAKSLEIDPLQVDDLLFGD
jgi:hypothetical protein